MNHHDRPAEMTEQSPDEAEGELGAWARQTTAIFEAMPDAVLLYDPSGNLVQVNTAARRLLGLDVVPDYVSRPLEERLTLYVVQDMQGQALPSEQWPISRLMRGEALADEQAMEVLLRTVDGRQIQASFTGGQVRDQQGHVIGMVLTLRDLSERYHLELELQEAEQSAREQASQLEAIFEAMPEALFVYDQEGRTTRMNAAGQQLYEHFRLSHAAAAPLTERVAYETVWNVQGQPVTRESLPLGRILAGEVLSPGQAVEVVLRDPQGEASFLSVSGGPLRDRQGQLVGAVAITRDITARKRTEQALRQQAEQLQLQVELIELANDAILVRDADDRIVSWNRGAEQLYGWSAQEALGWMTHELLQTDFTGSQAAAYAHLEREGQWEGELWQSRRDGRRILVESRQALVRDADGQPSAILEINRDITLRHELEAFARRMQTTTEARRALLQLVLDELPSGVYLVRSRDVRLVLANHAATDLWGASWELHQPVSEFLQQSGIRICGPDGRELAPEHWAALRVLQHGEAVSQQQIIIRQSDGTSLPVLVNAVPLDISLMFPTLQEITLAETQATEPAALVVYQDVSALKEAERLKDEFIAIAAHELRTPLAILKGYAETLLLGQQGRELEEAQWQKEALDNIELATRQLVELTEALLDVTRLQAGRLELHPEPSDLIALARRVIKRMQRTTEQHRLSLYTSQEHLVVPLDPGRMEQVLTNLLGNAIKYSPQGGPIEVTVWAEPQAEEVVLSVHDEGIGIPAQQQAGIFGRFFRADNAHILPGTGLGLYICRSLVELHGGDIWFESTEGVGTTFYLRLLLSLSISPPESSSSM